jgi:hypothetical protein
MLTYQRPARRSASCVSLMLVAPIDGLDVPLIAPKST